MKLAFDRKTDLALLILAWRLAINPPASWWRDPPAILAAFAAAYFLLDKRRAGPRATRIVTLATMAVLLLLFALRQVPLTRAVLGLGP